MNIDKIRENTSAQAAQKTVGIRAIRPQPVAENDAPVVGDQVDMSMISRLMARSIRTLAENDGVRPEVVAKHQPLTRQNARFDDQTIDRIFCRMLG